MHKEGLSSCVEDKGLENQSKKMSSNGSREYEGEASALGPRGELHNERAITCENASTAHYIFCFAFALIAPVSSS